MAPTPRLLIIGLTLAIEATPLAAQRYGELNEPVYPIGRRVEITPMVGYTVGGGASDSAGDRIELADGISYGGILSYTVRPRGHVEAIYLRQPTTVNYQPLGVGPVTALFPASVNYIQVGGEQAFGGNERVAPFAMASVGMTIFDPDTAGYRSETRFSMGVGGGVKAMLGRSQRVGLRLQGRVWLNFFDSGGQIFCGALGCAATIEASVITQWDFSGGIILAF
jgi:hypothetical protein